MKYVLLVVLLIFATPCRAKDVSVGGVSVLIPNPEGFGPVTPEMSDVQQHLSIFVPPESEQLAAFIAEADVQAAVGGEAIDLSRRFLVQTFDGNAFISAAYFAELKALIKAKNAEVFKRVERKLPGLIEKARRDAIERHELELAFSVSQLIPLPVHEDTERTMAYSALSQIETMDEFDRPVAHGVVVTGTLVHVRGKVLLLLCYAEDSAVEWTRAASTQWAKAIVDTNLKQSYRIVEVEHGIAIELPSDWKMASLEERTRFAAAMIPSLESANGKSQQEPVDSLFAFSIPDVVGANVSLRFRPGFGLTQEQLLHELETDPKGVEMAFWKIAATKIEQVRKVHTQQGVNVIGDYGLRLANAGELHGYVIRHRQRSDDGNSVFCEEKYYLPLGPHELIATFFYREGESLPYMDAIRRAAGSLRWNGYGDRTGGSSIPGSD